MRLAWLFLRQPTIRRCRGNCRKRGSRQTTAASPARATSAPLSIGVKLAAQGQYSKALTAVLEPITQRGVLADYATYYAGMAQLRLLRPNDALKTFKALRARKLVGYIAEAAALGEASADEALSDPAAAVADL